MLQMFVNETYNTQQDQTNSCYLHPEEKFVGVCPFCLNERLISLAYLSRQSFHCFRARSFTFCNGDRSFITCGQSGGKKPVLQKSFSMNSDVFHHLEFQQCKAAGGGDDDDDFRGTDFDESVSTSSQEESYITIKIDEEPFASSEKNNTKQSIKQINEVKKASETKHVNNKHIIQENKNVTELEHSTPVTTPKSGKRLSWTSCIGQLIRKKRSMRGWICRASIDKVAEGVEVRKSGWIRKTFVKRRESKKE